MRQEAGDEHLRVTIAASPPPIAVGGGVMIDAGAEESAGDVLTVSA